MKRCYVDAEYRAIADLCEYYEDGLLLTRINVPRASRGKGVARRLLLQVLQDADRTKTTLFLEILPSGGLSYEDLRLWYERHGFEEWKVDFWRRLPQ